MTTPVTMTSIHSGKSFDLTDGTQYPDGEWKRTLDYDYLREKYISHSEWMESCETEDDAVSMVVGFWNAYNRHHPSSAPLRPQDRNPADITAVADWIWEALERTATNDIITEHYPDEGDIDDCVWTHFLVTVADKGVEAWKIGDEVSPFGDGS